MASVAKILNAMSLGWLWLTVLLMPILALAGGLGFQAAGFAMGLSALGAWAVDRKGADYLRAAWPLWLIGFLLWAWVSTLWSPYEAPLFGGNASLLIGLVLPVLFVPLIILKMPERLKPAFVWVVIGAGLLGVLILLTDAMSGFALSLLGDPVKVGEDPVQRLSDAEMNLGRGQVSYIQLLWPVAILLMLRLKRGWVLACAAFAGLIVSAHFNNLLVVTPSLAFAVAFSILAWKQPRRGLIWVFVFAIISIVFAPLLGLLSSLIDAEFMRSIPLSWEHRLRMWDYSWDLIQQAPLFGHGFDASRSFDALTFRAPDGRNLTVMSMHPHNIGMHIWLETGLIGILLVLGFLVTLFKAILKICTQPARAFAVAGLVATITTSGAVTIGVWQHWWWALIVFVISLICLIPQETKNPSD